MKHIRNIIIRNFISPISIAIFILAAGLLYLGEVRDAWFISFVILVNSIIASAQEIRAYLTLKKIELLSAPKARILRDGEIVEILFNELSIGDKIFLKNGDEIPADCEIISANSFEINEAMLTGESVSIAKNAGEKALSGTIVVSGEAEAKVIAVGEQTQSGKMVKKLKTYKPSLTPIQRNISRVISLLTYFAIFLAVAIIWRYTFLEKSNIEILKTITSAAVVVVPEGLLLASSLFFAYGSVKLLQAKVLPQKISAIEDMALLQVLCTDKTGTLTSPEIIFDKIEILNGEKENAVAEILSQINNQTKEKNATASAILAKFPAEDFENSDFKIKNSMAFSSSRKLSGLFFEKAKKSRSVVFGAPEFILKNFADADSAKKIAKKVDDLASNGLRVLLLAEFENADETEKLLNDGVKLKPIAIVTLKNSLRENVQETVDFLQKRGVSLRVISGDNPKTVSFIAREAGVKNAEKFITGAELAKLSKKEFSQAVLENTIFARVLPEQKEKIISVFQKNKFYTGMIGDGVNDALAIKKSDLGIAMFDSAPATRRVADLVLMDNSFTSMPQGVKIGNRIMLAIEMIAVLFFHKIILGVTILFISLFAGINYPFLPRHITYMNFILVTMPTILTTLFPPIPGEKISPKRFWRDTLFAVAPVAVISGLAISLIYVSLSASLGYKFDKHAMHGVLATVVVMTALFGFYITIIGEKMLNSKTTKNTFIRHALYFAVATIFSVVIFGNRFLRDFFEFNLPSTDKFGFVLAVMILSMSVQYVLVNRTRENKITKN